MGSSNCFPHFNPRAREGRDFITFERCLDLRYFNPRAREGRDLSLLRRPLQIR